MDDSGQADRLFAAVVEELKTPLLQIARLSELADGTVLPRISAMSEQALRLVDAYMRFQTQTELLLEPVNTSAVLYDVANTLNPFAKQFNYDIEIDVRGKSIPIMAHPDSLHAMLALLGASIIEAGAGEAAVKASKCTLVLGTHRAAKGTVVGAFSSQISLSQKALMLTRQLHGRATQAVPVLGLAGGGLAVADKLSEQLSAPLRVYKHHSLHGIGSLLLPSRQLQFIV